MTNTKKKKPVMTEAEIDTDILNILNDEDIVEVFSDDVQTKRVVLNCFCELLSEVKSMRQALDEMLQTVSVCSTDKLVSFFKEVNTNFEKEKNVQELKTKIRKSHLPKEKK